MNLQTVFFSVGIAFFLVEILADFYMAYDTYRNNSSSAESDYQEERMDVLINDVIEIKEKLGMTE